MEDEFIHHRDEVTRRMIEEAEGRGGKVVVKTVYFSNNDAYNFIKELRRFGEESRKVRCVAKYDSMAA